MILAPLRAGETRDLDVGALLDRQGLGANGAGWVQPGEGGDHQGHLADRQTRVQRDGEQDQHEERRNRQADIDDAADDGVDPPTVVGGDQGHRGADRDADDAGQKPDVEGQRRGHDHHRQEVSPLAVGPERMLRRGRTVGRDRQGRGQRDIPDQAPDAGEEEEEDEEADPDHDLAIAAQVPQHRRRITLRSRLVGT